MSEPSFDAVWERDIYGQGQHLNRYPYDSVVTFLFRHAPRDRPRSAVRVLEVGCGAGNNLWMAAREGFQVAGVDGSASAIAYAKKRFEAEHLAADLRHGDFTELPFESASFDLAIDRASLNCCGFSVARRAIAEIARVLRPGGKLHFNPYSDRHSAAAVGPRSADGLVTMSGGPLAGVGQICFYGRFDLDAVLGDRFRVLSAMHAESMEMVGPERTIWADWRVIAQKVTEGTDR